MVGGRWLPWGSPGVPLLEGGPEAMVAMNIPSSKNVTRGRFRSSGAVMKGKGTSGKIAAMKDVTPSLFHRE